MSEFFLDDAEVQMRVVEIQQFLRGKVDYDPLSLAALILLAGCFHKDLNGDREAFIEMCKYYFDTFDFRIANFDEMN